MKKPKVVAIVQARMSSTRCPGKVLKVIDSRGNTLLDHVIARLKKSKVIDEIVIATTNNPRDEEIVEYAKKKKIPFFRGPEEDVLERFYEAAVKHKAEIIVRICADNPFIYVEGMDEMIKDHIRSGRDFTFNGVYEGGAPKGTVSEVISFGALKKANELAKGKKYREHVTPFLKEHPEIFKIKKYPVPSWLSGKRYDLAVDYPEDIDKVRTILDHFEQTFVPLREVIKYLEEKVN